MRTITIRVRAVDFAERIAAMRIWPRQVEWLPRVESEDVRFASDPPLEGSGFEPSVPLRECRRSEPLARKETSGVGNGVSSTGDRWFESGSLQRGVWREP